MGDRMQAVGVHAFPMGEPNDVRALEAWIEKGDIDPRTVVAIITKTERNGRVNDFTRSFAAHVFAESLGRHLRVPPEDVSHRIALVMSGGCEDDPACGRVHAAGSGGVGFSRVMAPEEVGTMAQVELVAEATKAAVKDAGLAPPAGMRGQDPVVDEAAGAHPARGEVAKLLLDEPREAAALAAVRHRAQEGLQVLANDGVEHGVLGVAGPIRWLGKGHALEYCASGVPPMPKDRYIVSVLGRASLPVVDHGHSSAKRSIIRAARPACFGRVAFLMAV
jgi:hypothetical protein